MKSQYRMLFAFVALLLVVSLACRFGMSPTPTEAPAVEEPTAVEVVPEQPQATEEPVTAATEAPVVEEPSSSAEQFFTEEFDGDMSNWSQVVELNAKEGNKSQANMTVEDGRLVFDFGKWLIGYAFYDPFTYTNVRVDMKVENRGTNVNNILLICRASDEGHYLVNVANSGLFGMYAFNGATGSYTRIADGGSNKIKSGKEINEYALVCNDKTITLFINGFEARSYTDNQFVFRDGQVGVGVASENQLPVKVEIEWVKISEP